MFVSEADGSEERSARRALTAIGFEDEGTKRSALRDAGGIIMMNFAIDDLLRCFERSDSSRVLVAVRGRVND